MTSVSGSICYGFSLNLPSAAQFAFKGQKATLKDNLSLNPNQCHHPSITQLTLDSKNLLLFSFLPLLIFTGFLKYPLELKKKFSENWKKNS